MKLTEEQKIKLQEKINQEPVLRKGRNEKAIGISTGIISGAIFFPIGLIFGIYWFLRGRKTRGTYALVTVASTIVVMFGIRLFAGGFLILLLRLLQLQ